MKILPKGASSFPGIILSAPCLAPGPKGLGLRTEPHAHVLQTLGVCLPRLEEEVEASRNKETVQLAFMLDSKEGLYLGPGETALVPVRASRTFAGDLEAKSGCHWGITLAAEGPVSETAAMLYITNASGLGIDLEMGHAIATGERRGEACTAYDYWSSSGSRGCASTPASDAEDAYEGISQPVADEGKGSRENVPSPASIHFKKINPTESRESVPPPALSFKCSKLEEPVTSTVVEWKKESGSFRRSPNPTILETARSISLSLATFLDGISTMSCRNLEGRR